jgi:hypothetical protein
MDYMGSNGGVFGFVPFMLGDSLRTAHVFIGISALAMYFYRPKREEFETLALAMQTRETPPPSSLSESWEVSQPTLHEREGSFPDLHNISKNTS